MEEMQSAKSKKAHAADWESFVNVVAHKELKRLKKRKVQYRIPPPGARF